MKVLMISHFPLAGSGSGTYTLNVAKHLTDVGHEVRVVMPENTAHFIAPDDIGIYPVFFSDSENSETIEGALPFNFPCFTSHPRSTQTFYDLSDEQLEAYTAAFRKAAEKAVKDFLPDLIHAQHIWLLAEIALETGIPYVITAHGTDLMGYQKTGRFRKSAHAAACGAKRIITISEDNDMLVKQLFPDCAEKTVFIKNGYDPSRFFPDRVTKEEVFAEHDIPPGQFLVLFTGKLTHFKGVDILLQAAKLYEGDPSGKIITIVAGEGDLSARLKKQAKSLKLRNTHFIGFLPIFQLRRLYSAADVTVVPSRREPFGLVALEALACGSPVIATNQGGLPDIINDRVGALVNVDDPLGLAEAVRTEIFNPDRAEKGRVCAEYVKMNFAQDKLIGALTDIYGAIVRPPRNNTDPGRHAGD